MNVPTHLSITPCNSLLRFSTGISSVSLGGGLCSPADNAFSSTHPDVANVSADVGWFFVDELWFLSINVKRIVPR